MSLLNPFVQNAFDTLAGAENIFFRSNSHGQLSWGISVECGADGILRASIGCMEVFDVPFGDGRTDTRCDDFEIMAITLRDWNTFVAWV